MTLLNPKSYTITMPYIQKLNKFVQNNINRKAFNFQVVEMWGADINSFLFLLDCLACGVESIGPLHRTLSQ